MVIRLSQQMMKKLHHLTTMTAEPAAEPLCDWALHLFRHGHIHYILATNTRSLFSVVLLGRGITTGENLLTRLIPALREAHRGAGLEGAFEVSIAPHFDKVVWSKIGNRAVTGSMNEMIHHAKWILDEDDLGPLQLGDRINNNILSLIGYQKPAEAHREMAIVKSEATSSQ